MTRATPEMIAAAWAAWHSRHGGKLGPGQTVNCDECLRSIASIKLHYSPKGRYYR